MYWNLLQAETTKILRRSILWIELGLLAFLIAFLYLLLYVTLQLPESATQMSPEARDALVQMVTWPGALANAVSMAAGNGLGGLIMVVLVGAVTAQEYSWRTMQLWLGNGVPRPQLLIAKLSALLLPAALVVLVPLLVGGVVSAFLSVRVVGSLSLEGVDLGDLARTAVLTAYTLLPYASLTFLLAILTRSVAAAIGIGVAYTLLLESTLSSIANLVGGFMATAMQYLPSQLAAGLLQAGRMVVQASAGVSMSDAPQPQYLEPLPAAIGLALYTLVFLGAAVWAFRRQDLSG